jgi:excinuclease ABC subunit A
VATKPRQAPECIRLRGVRQNNLKGLDLDLPLNRYIVVTGLSGAGKSSLVFETLHAEGQRRYVETFSPYTRQFLELLDRPRIDSISNIRPSIAIEQRNTVKTSRSTVGTMTELTDYFKVWFSHAASCFDPQTGEKVEDDNPASVWSKVSAAHAGRTVVAAFRVDRPANMTWAEIAASLGGQGYTRFLAPAADGTLAAGRVDSLPGGETDAPSIHVVQDRIVLEPGNRARFIESVETAMHFGRGEVALFGEVAAGAAEAFEPLGRYSRGLHSPSTGRTFRQPSPALFSFNSPLGACPRCRGFGRVIEIDTRLAIPDQSLSINGGAIRCWEGDVYGESLKDLRAFARRRAIPLDIPFAELTPEQKSYVVDGEPGYGEEGGKTWPKYWYGVRGFFRWLEKNAYKMHVRVFLSRFRAYNTCPDCGGSRLQPEALCWKWEGRTLPALYALPVSELLPLVEAAPPPAARAPHAGLGNADLAHEAIVTRLRYLSQVGLDYLTLDRPAKTLSGGEVERVNLTSCLGTSLVDTLFVLDEPSVGLHPRDIDRLIGIIRSLTQAGNTVVVVEHDEALIRAADHVVEVGPGPGAGGGRIVFEGSVRRLLESRTSITGAYLSGRERIPVPPHRRPAPAGGGPGWLRFRGAAKHNVRGLDLDIPLGRLVCLSGVSGAGKSTLLDNVIHQGLLAQRLQFAEDPAVIAGISGAEGLAEVALMDQSPLSRTPRSNAAVYTGTWELVRELYAATPEARSAGFTSSSFSFNSGDGRCGRCQGLGFERVEMQFLSDVFVPCPVCEGRRFKPEVLAVEWRGRSVADLLATSVSDALGFFAGEAEVCRRLAVLDSVGLGYLTLGQPLNSLSGGEAQRLKLVRYLGGLGGNGPEPAGASLLLLDEPTTGLHRHDVRRLLEVLGALVDRGHSVVVVEHNLDVLKSADWIIEVGPEAGSGGGRIVAAGTPEAVAQSGAATAPFLRDALAGAAAPAPPRAPGPAGGCEALVVTGARENNLRNVSVSIRHRAFTVITGVSGSGKSTLAFDIVFAEGQRRFMESMSAYARQFVEQMPRPAIDRLTGIPPTVAIEQRVTRGSRKSTVATITEVAQYLRLLYARLGVQHHPDTGRPVVPLSRPELVRLLGRVLRTPAARRARHLHLCAPLVQGRKGHHQPIATWIAGQGYELMRADGRVLPTASFRKLDRYREHDIEAVVADLAGAGPAARAAALDDALRLGRGSCFLATPRGVLSWFSSTRTDAQTGESFPELEPKHFSFNSPRGWCPTCRGYGRIFDWMLEPDGDEELPPEIADLNSDVAAAAREQRSTPCPACNGARINRMARAVRLPFRGGGWLSLPELLALPPSEIRSRLRGLRLDRRGRLVTQDILPQIGERLGFLDHVGLGYLSLDRPTETLSGGEAQRIRLAAQLGSNLSGVLYVLDEPSIGLHARDNERLIGTLKDLRSRGNTLLVVEHDEEVMAAADRILDLGPGAGVHGGELLADGTPAEIRRNARSLTGLFLKRGIAHPLRGSWRDDRGDGRLRLAGASFRNLRGVNLDIPTGRLVMVAGASGAGKSTLFRDLLVPAVACAIRARRARLPGSEFVRRAGFAAGGGKPPFRELSGGDRFRAVIEVDQSPIGKTPRSSPATYLGIFDQIRAFFATLPEARMRGYTASRFSFNVAGGRCPTCEGAGRIRLEMAFMPDTYLPCEDCRGLRYGPELDDVVWKGRTIGQVLQMTFEEAAVFFDFHSRLSQVCRLMADCGLGYLALGQSSPTLSGGEAQRLKLVTELARGIEGPGAARGPSANLYLLEEPTIGLHLSDCEKLIRVLHSLVDQGHTVIVIEHHMDLLAEADAIVELGPGGGPEGGRLLYQGALPGLLRVKESPTAPYLRRKLKSG